MPGHLSPLGGEPPTGEPCAGDPHARFGGRGGQATGLPYPYQISAMRPRWVVGAGPRACPILPVPAQPGLRGFSACSAVKRGFRRPSRAGTARLQLDPTFATRTPVRGARHSGAGPTPMTPLAGRGGPPTRQIDLRDVGTARERSSLRRLRLCGEIVALALRSTGGAYFVHSVWKTPGLSTRW